MLLRHGLRPPQVHFAAKLETAMATARAKIKELENAGADAAGKG
jgi:hypothetical protein